jgi:superfamily II DNA or RNA helicase
MLPRQPLRFLLADDPGAGKTIMAGLLIKELIARGDLQRCLIVCPGSLAEQWQDEMDRRFHLPFDILTNEGLEAARTGNWFLEHNLVIARLDKLSRNEDVQIKLAAVEGGWDLIVCDEAHKMSATYFGGEARYTKRYRLAQQLGQITRHFLLMTATPHNGKDEDFQLFMALLDADRFEGRPRDGVRQIDVSDMMRRMVKENLLKFDATRLFPERRAYTVQFHLSDLEARLYHDVTEYVRNEFARAEALQDERRAGTVGFALTILQRRLASSPEAIYQSLRRRKERLQKWLRELELMGRGANNGMTLEHEAALDPQDIEDLEDAPESELEAAEEEILDESTAARSMLELRAEIETLKRLEALAMTVKQSDTDCKWRELRNVLNFIFQLGPDGGLAAQGVTGDDAGDVKPSASQKLVLFTEHRDTLNYLHGKIATLLGSEDAIVCIHGQVGREQRLKAQEQFRHNPEVRVLLATDAAGEGINLQRAHLMVNYDLPWNPNRLEQRFGRIHRIGQTEVCHLWNLVASETREGDVYLTLFNQLEEARASLGGQVFDVLGKLEFEGKPLRDLLVEAIRYGEQPEVKARLIERVEGALDTDKLRGLVEDHALAHDTMDAGRIFRIREEMERAELARLQPFYVESFFLKAFRMLGGTAREREGRRYEITHVPAPIRQRDRQIGRIEPVLARYERVAFEKSLLTPQGQPPAAFLCPGHPLLDATLDLVIERHRDLLRRGTVLVDDLDDGDQPRILFFLEHAIQDASVTRTGENRIVSQRMLYVNVSADGAYASEQGAPYLNYRPLAEGEPGVDAILSRPELDWLTHDVEGKAQAFAIAHVVPAHVQEVVTRRTEWVAKTRAAVKARLTQAITHWDQRAADNLLRERAGRAPVGLNSTEARRRADDLQARLARRMRELDLEERMSPRPPVVLGGVLVVPAGLLRKMRGVTASAPTVDKQAVAAKARAIVMKIERELGFIPVDREADKVGYDVESAVPSTGRLRFIEVKGRTADADTITVTKNEILYSFNKPDEYILAIVEFSGENAHRVHYVRQPFKREPDFAVTSVNYDMAQLIALGGPPA